MSTEAELKKLTVPQLKVLCKEKRITGYSKLGKDAIIQKLLGTTLPSGPAPQSTPSSAPDTGPIPDVAPIPAPSLPPDSSIPAPKHPESTSKPRAKKRKNPIASANAPSTSAAQAPPADNNDNAPPSQSQPPSAEPSIPSHSGAESTKKQKNPITGAAASSTETTPAPANSSMSLVPLTLTTDPSPSNPTPDSSTQKTLQPRPKKRKNPPASEESSTASSAHVFKVPAVPQRAVQESAPGSVSSSTIPTPAPSAPLKKKKKNAADKPSSTSDPVARETSTSSATKKKKTIPADVQSPSTNASADSIPTKPSKKTPAGVPIPPTVNSTAQSTLMATGSHPLPTPNVSKRPSTTLAPADPPPPKKRKVTSPSPTPQRPPVPKFVLPRKAPAVATPSTPSVVPGIPINVLDMRPKVPQKRFVPLVVTKKVLAPAPAVAAPPDPAFVPIAVEGSAPQPLYYLDFPIAAAPKSLSMITLPPSLSQRKRVPRFALFLSSVADEDDLRNCLLVSRMFRYAGKFYPLVHAPHLTISVAVYLSAAHRLDRNFAGQRLSAVLAKYPRNTTNMWPYLEQRQQELSARKRQYTSSFLGRLFPRGVISDRLWTSPDHDRQIVVALRFLLTRLFFQVSVGGGKEGKGWREGQIVNAEQLVEDEIWEITVRHTATSTERFYVLEPTCEPLTTTTDSPETGLPVRTDWSAYIAHRTLSVDFSPPRLLNYMSWTNHEEYLLGISRLWLKRIEGEGEIGTAKRITAERYILACVVGNSVSGRWMSSTQMAQDFAGLADNAPARVAATPKVNLFLPKHHHVESVHFATSGRVKTPLHSTLAVVQTPDREYFILRDNGMQVGCEEEGIAEAWMNIIGCTNSGVATAV